MHIKRGVYLTLADRLQLKAYSRLSQIIIVSAVGLLVVCSVLLMFKNTFATPPCPCSVFSSQDPATPPGLYNQSGGIEVGFKFTVDHAGYISGVRFYKVAGMSGVHTASLWNSFGARLATATFAAESAAGWQEINFAPIAVVANRPYVASVFMADGNYTATPRYFTSVLTNTPFVIPQDGDAWDGAGHQGQGVFDTSGASAYPIGSFNANNYWVDTVYVSSPSLAAPTVTTTYPTVNATNVTVSDAMTATFDKQLNSVTVSTDTVIVKDMQGSVLPGVVSYDQATSMIKFIPNALLQTNATYTVTLRGGVGNVITDYEGHNLGADYQWSFTTSPTPLTCPCSLKNKQAPTTATSYREAYPNGLELGLKVVPATKGYIRAIRFYKPLISNQMSHVGHIWDSSGNALATVTFTNESEYGWQEATLTTPLSVLKDHVYIVSFGLTTPQNYVATINGLTTAMVSPGMSAFPSGDSRNGALGSGVANSVYAETIGAYPSSPASSNQDYMIDAVFSLQSSDIEPLKLIQAQPSINSYGIKADTALSATFDQALDQTSVNASSVYVRGVTGANIPGGIDYDGTKHAITFTPTAHLTAGGRYSATITANVRDVRGEHLPSTYSWSFTVGGSPVIDMNQGKGGPILIVTSGNDNYGKYYAEILRTEGINYFDVRDIAGVTPAVLDNYKAVILSQTALTQTQTDMLQAWVSNGGSLVAMRPDKKLAGTLGFQDAGGTLTNGYLKVDTATTPGLGIVSETMQYKGTAGRYTTTAATVVAQLYSDGVTESPYPAVTTRFVGRGTAMAFSYDLAKSVIGLHQGNLAWAGQDRNNDGAARTTDLFYGAAVGDSQPDWLDTSKMDIPQADEQQRLLVNLLTDAMKKNLPAPRFWYLPNNEKTALVLAGDDHGQTNASGSEQQLDHLLNLSEVGCSVMDWGCARATHYVYANAELSDARAHQFANYGFEIGAHPTPTTQGCNRMLSYDQLAQEYANSLSSVRLKYTSLPYQRTARFHCYAWPSWDWMPRVDAASGVRYDLNTVAYPASWVGTHSPMVTGSGMNMRLTDAAGSLLDVRQAVTNFDNATAGAASIAAMFDNALGVKGYYGIFGSHYDMADTYQNTLYAIASSRHIPIISADQALTWLDGRAGSNFSNLSSNETGRVTFSIDTAEGAYGLQAMMPMQDATGTLSAMTLAGQSVEYQTEIIKGVQYAIFKAQPGSYEVIYSDFDTTSHEAGRGSIQGPYAHAKPSNSSLVDTEATVSPDTLIQIPSSLPGSHSALARADTPSAAQDGLWGWIREPIFAWITGGSCMAVGGGGVWWLLKLRRH